MYEKALKIQKTIFSKVKINKLTELLICFLSATVMLPGGYSPFGISSLLSGNFSNHYWVLCIVVGSGYLICGISNGFFYMLSAICMYLLSLLKLNDFFKKYKKILFCSVFIFNRILSVIINDFSIYGVMQCILETAAVYFLADHYTVALNYINKFSSKNKVLNKEKLSLMIVGLVLIASLSNIVLPFNLNTACIVCITIMFFMAYKFNISVCAVGGIVLGLAAGINNINMIYCVATFAVSGFFSAFAKKYGKTGVIITFILSNALFTYIINGSDVILLNLYEILIAGTIYYLIPDKKLSEIKYNITNMITYEDNENVRMNIVKNLTNTKLEKLSNAFESISSILLDNKKDKQRGFAENCDAMVKTLTQRVCKNCRGAKRCWKNDSTGTYNTLLNLFYVCEKRGWVEQYDIQPSFQDICFNCSQLVLETNKIYELYRMNKIWESRADENKIIISQQFGSMSRVTSNLAEELKGKCSFRRDIEDELINEFEISGVKVVNITVMRVDSRHFNIKLNVKRDDKVTKSMITDICQKVMGKRMKINNLVNSSGITKYDISEEEMFYADVGVSRIRPDNTNISGDSYSIMRPDGEKVIVALSDGMGSGAVAAKESKAAVNLLEKILSAGIEKNAALKLVNSVLLLKSFDESFATIDMFVFDVYTGEGEFIKIGGVSSYILRNQAVTEIKAGTLPAGILTDTQSYSYKTQFKEGDVVVILSDGVTDISRDDEWLKEVLKNNSGKTGKETADMIMEEACRKISVCKDDMTVITVKINAK